MLPPIGRNWQLISPIEGHLHETAQIGLIFAVKLILPGCLSNFCKHLTDRHHIAQNQTEIGKFLSQNRLVSLAKSYGQPGKNQWEAINCKQITRWQHVSQLKASSFGSW
jgi:hypothetical protein